MPALIVKHGPNPGQRYEIDGELVVGREDAGLTIEDSELSRKHAVIRPRDDALEIEDLGSLNGTFVNGTKIEVATRISGGDTIKIGMTTLEVEAVTGSRLRDGRRDRAPAETAVAPRAAEPAPRPAGPPREKPTEAFGAFVDPSSAKRGKVASRFIGPTLVSWIAVSGTAVALAIYFSQR